jgi:hypothetical protein
MNAASDCGRKLFLEFKHGADITPVYGELVRPAGLGDGWHMKQQILDC